MAGKINVLNSRLLLLPYRPSLQQADYIPLCTPLNQHLFRLNEQEYEKIVKERKMVILQMLLASNAPVNS